MPFPNHISASIANLFEGPMPTLNLQGTGSCIITSGASRSCQPCRATRLPAAGDEGAARHPRPAGGGGCGRGRGAALCGAPPPARAQPPLHGQAGWIHRGKPPDLRLLPSKHLLCQYFILCKTFIETLFPLRTGTWRAALQASASLRWPTSGPGRCGRTCSLMTTQWRLPDSGLRCGICCAAGGGVAAAGAGRGPHRHSLSRGGGAAGGAQQHGGGGPQPGGAAARLAGGQRRLLGRTVHLRPQDTGNVGHCSIRWVLHH